MTQYSLKYLEDVDLIKFDFLGLKTLTVIDNAIKLVKQRTGRDIIWEQVDKNDSGVYKMIQSGQAIGIFQIEGEGMRKLGTSLRPDCFEDIVAMLALYRPGPMESGMLDDFVKRKHGEAEITYAFKELEPILAPTYGVIVYQEQVMQIVQAIGGFSLGGADLVRRAMGKKIKEEMDRLKGEFVKGAEAKGLNGQKADDLFELIVKFAGYGFNKSHSAAYAYVTFQTAYLKAYYPAEFMAALLTSEESNVDKIVRYIDEIKRINIDTLPPSINKSTKEFSVVKNGDHDGIIFGLGAIKGVGGAAIENIIAERDAKGEFKSMDDFVSRIDPFKVNKKVFESLIKAGCFDEFGFSRKMLLQNVENIVEACKNAAQIRKNAAESLFGEDDSMNDVKINFVTIDDEFDVKQILKFEQESVGIYLSGHPLDDYKDEINKIKYTLSSEFETLPQSAEILVVGKIEDFSTRITKSGKKMGTINVLDFHGNIEIAVFERELGNIEDIVKDEAKRDLPYAFRINISRDDQFVRTNLNEVYSLEDAQNLDFKTRKLKQNSKFSKNDEVSAPQKAREYAELEVLLSLSELSRQKLEQIYSLVFSKNAPNNQKRLILKIKNEATGEIFIYKTEFIISDDVGEEIEKLAASA